jgi:hypothetical protein
VWREKQTGRTKTIKGHYLLLISSEDVDRKIVVTEGIRDGSQGKVFEKRKSGCRQLGTVSGRERCWRWGRRRLLLQFSLHLSGS